MSWVVNCEKEFSWKCNDDESLRRIPDEMGVGEHHMVVYDCDSLDEYGHCSWTVWDGSFDEGVDIKDGIGEILLLSEKDREVIKQYLKENIVEHPEPLQELLSALLVYLEGRKDDVVVQAVFG